MKLLLISFVWTIGCYAENDNLNVTSFSLLEKSEFESNKLMNGTQSSPDLVTYNVTTNFSNNENDTVKKLIGFKKKPPVKVKKLKKVIRNKNEISYKVYEDEKELKKNESKSQVIYSFPETLPPLKTSNFVSGSNETQMKETGYSHQESRNVYNFQNDENSRIRFSGSSPEDTRNRQYINHGKLKLNNPQRVISSHPTESRNIQNSRNKNDGVKFTYKFESYPQESRNLPRQQQFMASKKQRRGGRPSLPEIQNVIQTLDSQENTEDYTSPKQNHIVEVHKVPLVFEHHYQGDYKDPQSQFVAHQYSYSPPADNSNEAYQLGKILSQNVVEKLHSAQKPLKEFVDDQQEIVLTRPKQEPFAYSQQIFVTPHLKGSISNSKFLHPLMRYLAPEIKHQDFSQELQQFQRPNVNSYQVYVPRTQMQPIVVEDDQSKPDFKTTYLQAVSGQQLETHQHQHSSNQQYTPSSPYSVNVQPQFMAVPKYTMGTYLNLQNNIKPQAIHEVEPPNLSGFRDFKNVHFIRDQGPPVLASPHSEFLRNTRPHGHDATPPTSYANQYDSPQEHGVENFNSKLRLGDIISKPELIHYLMIDSPSYQSAAPIKQQTRTPLIKSRPYWRKPHSMKLIRVPQLQNHQTNEENYRPHSQSFGHLQEFEAGVNQGDNQGNYNNIEQQQYIKIESNEAQRNEEVDGYSNNFVRLLPHQQLQQINVEQRQPERPIQVQGMYTLDLQESTDKPREAYYSQNDFENQPEQDNSKHNYNQDSNRFGDKLKYQPNIEPAVEIVKSESPQYFEEQGNHQDFRENSVYTGSVIQEIPQQGSELPKGYLAYQDKRNNLRSPTMLHMERPRHVMPLVRSRFREVDGDFKGKILYPRLRRLISNLMAQNGRPVNSNYVVLMQEHDER